MTDYDKSIHTNPDAMAWAELYKETFPESDKELMLVWFANAMMAMHDHIKLNLSDHIPEGYALVPVEPTEKMVNAAILAPASDITATSFKEKVKQLVGTQWKAMIKAAQEQQ